MSFALDSGAFLLSVDEPTDAPPKHDAAQSRGGVVVDIDVAAAVRGSREAQARLLTRLTPRVFNLVRYLVRGDPDAEDLAQDALVTVLVGLPSFRNEAPFDRWWERVVVRSVFASLKTKRSRAAHHHRDGDAYAAPDPRAREDASYATRRQMVQLLDELPYDQRHAVVLHHVLELSVPEIAEELGVPLETVRSRLRLAAKKLRERLSVGRESEPPAGAPR